MKKSFVILILFVLSLSNLKAAYSDWFTEATLRLDFVMSGDSEVQEISLDEMYRLPYWAGRRHHLDSLLLDGNGRILVNDAETGRLIYAQSFSTLFQEWQLTPEAKQSHKSFESCFLVPFPKNKIKVTLQLSNSYRKVTSSRSFSIDPADIQIRSLSNVAPLPHRYIQKGGTPEECVDVAVLAEGYREEDMDSFYLDVQKVSERLFEHEPFRKYRKRFNIIAVASPSIDKGVSVPRKNSWKNTALGAQFDTFYSERYLTTLHMKRMQDLLTGIPFEHIVILVNSAVYGGGGIYNLYMISTAHNDNSLPVCVHEFGHSFAGLGDEYGYADESDPYYHPGIEPWEKNLTTLTNFKTKWKKMLPKKCPIPTPVDSTKKNDTETIGVYEGGGYLLKGVYRPAQDCRMKVNNVPSFCPVCRKAIEEVILYSIEP